MFWKYCSLNIRPGCPKQRQSCTMGMDRCWWSEYCPSELPPLHSTSLKCKKLYCTRSLMVKFCISLELCAFVGVLCFVCFWLLFFFFFSKHSHFVWNAKDSCRCGFVKLPVKSVFSLRNVFCWQVTESYIA